MSRTLPLLVFCLCMVPLAPGSGRGDEIDIRLKSAVAFIDGKTADSSAFGGFSSLSPDERLEIVKRSAAISAPARALLLYELAKAGQPEAVAELESIFKQPGAITGRIKKFPDPLDIRDYAWNGREKGKPVLQSLAAGLLLALDNIPEDLNTLVRYTKFLAARPKTKPNITEIRNAVTYIGFLHLREISNVDSQKELEKALQLKEDPDTRKLAAIFISVTGEPRSAKLLIEAVRGGETDASNLERIARILIAGGNYTEAIRCSFLPDLIAMYDNFDIPDKNRQYARLVVGQITGLDKVDAQRDWISRKEKELAEKNPQDNKTPPSVQDPNKPKPPHPPTPVLQPKSPGGTETPPPPPPANPDAECAKWLLLAKNFMNMKNYDKAEENLKRVLDKCPQGKASEEARELLKNIETLKGL